MFLKRSGQSCSYSKRSTFFHSVNKQQPGDWQAALLDVWWNNRILICAEIWLEEADLKPNHTSELWRFFFFFCLFLFFPQTSSFFFSQQDGCWCWYHYTPLHYRTLYHGAQFYSFHACCCQHYWQAALYSTKSRKLINCASLVSQPFEPRISLWAVYVPNIFRAPYRDGSSTYPECWKSMTPIDFISDFVSSLSASCI